MAPNSRIVFTPSQNLPTRALSLRLGLKFVGERPLTPDEIVELERETQKYKKRSTIFGWLTFLVLVSPCLFGLVFSILFPGGSNPRYDHVTDLVVGFIVVPLMSTSILFWILFSEGQQRGTQGLGWDIRAGVVQQFQGRAQEFKDRRFVTQFFVKNPVVSTEETVHLVEVLPHAQRLWKIDGVVVAPWKMLDRVPKLAAPPRVVVDEALASFVPRTLPTSVPAEVIGERELTTRESEELGRRLQSRSNPNVFLLIGINFLLMFVGRMIFDHFLDNKPLSAASLIVPGVCLLLGLPTISDDRRAKRQISQDLAERRVLQVHISTSRNALLASQRQGINIEILPHTRWIWTNEGQPPRWRTERQQNKRRWKWKSKFRDQAE